MALFHKTLILTFFKGGIISSSVKQKWGKLCNDLGEGECIGVTPFLAALMVENLRSYVYRE